MKSFSYLLALAAALAFVPPAAAQNAQADEAELQRRIQNISSRLHPVTGDVRIPGANAVLHLGDDYYFLPASEARVVLTEGWGNPVEATEGVLGMVFPAGRTFADDTWGAVVTYEDTGHVADDDAQSTDYAALLREMQEGEGSINEERTRQGFPTQHLVGWAQTPVYDARTHSVVWARNIQFQGSPENTLNYDIRLLGRSGVLSLNMVTVMSDLAETREAAQRFAASAEFQPGARYADFQPGRDRVAEYGVAGLIAAGVGAAAAKKAGLIAILLAFGKKFIILIIAGFAAFGAWLRRLFGRKSDEEEFVYEESAAQAWDEAQAPQPAPSEGNPDEPAPSSTGS
jgi:uncharacterized membrane-anchored protein